MKRVLITIAFGVSISLTTVLVRSQEINYTLVDPDAATDPSTWETWGIGEDDWRLYEKYMKGEGKYHYQHLDPVFVLGMISSTEVKKDEYAAKYAQQEFARTARLIEFDNRYSAKANELFGQLDTNTVGDPSGFSSRDKSDADLVFGDRITMFVDTDCPTCSDYFNRYQSKYTVATGVSIDLFFVGSNITDSSIRKWAFDNGIVPEDVTNNRITLNHDDRYELFGKPEIPSAYHLRDDRVLGAI